MSTLSFGPFVIDLDSRRVLRDGRDLALRPRAFQALRLLAVNSGQFVDHERMIAEGWEGTIVSPHTVNVTIGEVRKALGEYQSWVTHRTKVGYRLDVPDPNDLIRRGWHFWSQHTREGFEEALSCFSQAAEQTDRDFRAFEGMASCRLMLAALGMKPPIDMQPGFLYAHARATELSGGTPELRCDAAHGLHIFESRYAQAESALLDTRREKPELTSIYSRLAMLHYACGRLDAAMNAIADGRLVDPYVPAFAALETYVWLARRQFDVAAACGRRAVALHPHVQMVHSLYGQALEFSGQFEQALAQYRIAATISPDLSCLAALEGSCLAHAGRRRDALAVLQRLDAQRRTTYVDAYYLAVLLTTLGAHEQAFKELERASDEHSSALHTIHVDPRMDPLRGHPRFERLRGRHALTH